VRRSIAITVLAGVLALTATACGEDGLQVGDAASEIAEGARDAGAQVESQLGGQEGQEAEAGGDAAAPPEEPQPEESQAPDAGDASSSLLPLLLLALVVILLLAAVAAWLGRRGRAADSRQRLRDEALLETDWLIDVASEQPSLSDAAARARDIRVRVDRLTDGLRRLEGMAGRRTVEAATALRGEATALAQSVIARLDDVATGRRTVNDLDVDTLIERTRFARDRFIDAS
jgi:hypothetical protein